jgi:uncharacterized membrane protein
MKIPALHLVIVGVLLLLQRPIALFCLRCWRLHHGSARARASEAIRFGGGVVGLVVCTVGAVVTWNRGSAFGPHWYPLALVATAVPCAWLGGQLRVMQLGQSDGHLQQR